MSAKCSTCGAPIRWAMGHNGKRIPLDAEPAPNGNVRIAPSNLPDVGTWATYVTRESPAAPGEVLYLSHFATCPDAKTHRKPKGDA